MLNSNLNQMGWSILIARYVTFNSINDEVELTIANDGHLPVYKRLGFALFYGVRCTAFIEVPYGYGYDQDRQIELSDFYDNQLFKVVLYTNMNDQASPWTAKLIVSASAPVSRYIVVYGIN